MKHTLTMIALVTGMGFSAASHAADAPKSHEQTIGISEAYIPGGFSSDTDAYVVVSGMFPNSCYHFSRADVRDGIVAMTHEVRLYANVAEGLCLMVQVPFTQEVRLGQLERGEHTLRFVNGDNTFFERKIVIE